MNPWKNLKIKPTADESVIKKAYAAELRKHHPEDDPEGYQTLREAYDFALKYAKSVKTEELDETDDEDITTEISVINLFNITSALEVQEKQEDSFQDAPILVQRAEILYNDFFLRIEADNWESLLKSEAVWSIDDQRKLCISMLDFFSKHRYLPPDIWRLLNNHFNWCDPDDFHYYEAYSVFIQYIRDQISHRRPCNFACFKPENRIEFEEYLICRGEAYQAFLANDFYMAGYFIENAKRIFKDDQDLKFIEGKLCLVTERFDEAILLLKSVLMAEPENSEIFQYLMVAYYEKGKDNDYRECFHRINKRYPRADEMPYFIANSYYDLGEFFRAYKWICMAMKSNPTSKVKVLWSQISARLKLKLEDEHENDPMNDDIALRLDTLENDIKRMNIGDVRKKSIQERMGLSPRKVFWIIWILFMLIRYILRINN